MTEHDPYGTVVSVERIAPRIVRIVLGGDGLAQFDSPTVADAYLSVLIPPEGADVEVPFSAEALRESGHTPARRRYTVRRWDPAARELTVDFVVHGDVGAAGRWANNAQPGDMVQISNATGGYVPAADADWYLMVGDESALPAIANSLELIPSGRPVLAVLLVDDEGHHIDLPSTGDLTVVWVHRLDADDAPGRFLAAVESLDFPAGSLNAFVHGEAAETRSVRKHLLGERGIAKEQLSVSPYWRRGQTDEAWRQVKRDWLMEQETDVPAGT